MRVQDIVDLLNEALTLDREAVTKLVEYRVGCNDALADHPTIQCSEVNGVVAVGLLGILNGFIGKVREDDDSLFASRQTGYKPDPDVLVAVFGLDGRVEKFRATKRSEFEAACPAEG